MPARDLIAASDTARVVGWVNLVVLSFCYLQWWRGQRLSKAGKQERPAS